jgi:hypothetical protein
LPFILSWHLGQPPMCQAGAPLPLVRHVCHRTGVLISKRLSNLAGIWPSPPMKSLKATPSHGAGQSACATTAHQTSSSPQPATLAMPVLPGLRVRPIRRMLCRSPPAANAAHCDMPHGWASRWPHHGPLLLCTAEGRGAEGWIRPPSAPLPLPSAPTSPDLRILPLPR